MLINIVIFPILCNFRMLLYCFYNKNILNQLKYGEEEHYLALQIQEYYIIVHPLKHNIQVSIRTSL